jgi:Mn2+/Fe2+ NRAMP family transporter
MVSVALLMVYFCLDIIGRKWKYREGYRLFQWLLALWIIIPGVLSPFWKLPALIQAIIAMAGNLILAPLAVLIIMLFINKKSYMKTHTANTGRNIMLGITFLFSLFVVVYGIVRFIEQF